MTSLDNDAVREIRKLRQQIGCGWTLSQTEINGLRAAWSPRIHPDLKDTSEDFAVCRPDGSLAGVAGPRWLFHLLGLAHRAAHIGFATPTGQVILQRRAQTKADWPDAWDIAVAGHVPQHPDGTSMTFEEGALKEIREELGLPEDLRTLVAEKRLVAIGSPRFTYEQDEARNPPFYNAEIVQNFGATLNSEGLARLKPDWEELGGIYLCSPQMAWDTLIRGPIASGLRFSLPIFLDWLEQKTLDIDTSRA